LENPERAAASTKRRDDRRVAEGGKRNLRQRYPFAVFRQGAHARAVKTCVPFALTPDDLRRIWLHQEGKCFWLGVQLDFSVGGARHPMRPSIDRLVASAGYVVGNVVWSTNFANRARGELGASEFLALLKGLGIANRYDTKLAQAWAMYA
jgi:hypothetical protein